MRPLDDLNLREAFPPMPDECREALRHTTRSLKEEPMKQYSRRAVLIAVCLVVVTMAVAYAANQLGLSDLFSANYNISIPDSAKAVLSVTEQKSYEVGPLTFTLRETLADGRLVYMTALAQAREENILIADGLGETNQQIPESMASRLGLPKDIGVMEAAQRTKARLVQVSAYLTPKEDVQDGDEMMDALSNEDGSVLLIDMLSTDPSALSDKLDGTVTFRVQEINVQTGEYIEGNDWRVDETISIPVNGVHEERYYLPEGDAQIGSYQVQEVLAEKTSAGIYLTIRLSALEGANPGRAYELYKEIKLQDAREQGLPVGMSLSGEINIDKWPEVMIYEMTSLNELPDMLQLVYTKDNSAVTLL